jgi:hypothetical protein
METKDIYYYNDNFSRLSYFVAHDIKMHEADKKNFKTPLKLNELITLAILYHGVTIPIDTVYTSFDSIAHLFYINKFYKTNLYYKNDINDPNAVSIITFNNGHEFGIRLCDSYKNSEIDRMLYYVNKHF